MSLAAADFDHPIFVESIRRIRLLLGESARVGVAGELLARLVHSSGDPAIAPLLGFSPA
jgi:precorrin-8X/cobalt-precorrin-8 methylmutase